MARRALPALLLLVGALCVATPAPAASHAPCTRAAADHLLAREHLGDFIDFKDPTQQLFCGPFAGRHSRAMVVSLALPSCGFAYGWVVYRSVHGKWRRILNRNAGAMLTRSGRRILEWQGVLAQHDPHCFPSSARVRAWHWNGRRMVHGRWRHRAHLPTKLPGMHTPIA